MEIRKAKAGAGRGFEGVEYLPFNTQLMETSVTQAPKYLFRAVSVSVTQRTFGQENPLQRGAGGGWL